MNKELQYCVYLTSYYGCKLPPKHEGINITPYLYIGYTSVKNIKKGYRGSVESKQYKEIWKNEVKNNKEVFDTVIISYHTTKEDAIKAETELQRKCDVVNSPLYINKHIGVEYFLPSNTEDRRKQQSEFMKKHWSGYSEEQKTEIIEKMKSNNMFNVNNIDSIDRWYSCIIKAWDNKERKKNLSNRNVEMWKDVDIRERLKISISSSVTPERRKQMSEGAKERWKDPYMSNLMITRMMEIYTPEFCDKRSEITKETYKNRPDLLDKRKIAADKSNVEEFKTLKSMYKILGLHANGLNFRTVEWMRDKIEELIPIIEEKQLKFE